MGEEAAAAGQKKFIKDEKLLFLYHMPHTKINNCMCLCQTLMRLQYKNNNLRLTRNQQLYLYFRIKRFINMFATNQIITISLLTQ